MMMLAAVAARTHTIQLGTTSYLLPIRHPLLAAEQVACLDRLSSGRLILGLGRGFQPGMLNAFNVVGSEKRALFENCLSTMLSAWRGEPVGDPDYELLLSPLPLQQPHPPLWVAAFGPKAIGQVGRLGLPYLASPMETLEELSQNHDLHVSACESAGQAVPEDVIIMRTVFISEDPSRCNFVTAGLASAPRPGIARNGDASVSDWALIGNREQVRAGLLNYREQLAMSHLIAVRPRMRGIEESWQLESLQALQDLRAELP
jgi:alkanesulfonate monooxygenase SsuD/methylene tetrahydromethanopterin reductase-like flavin-dependent oxidoreductase (luciferase family)